MSTRLFVRVCIATGVLVLGMIVVIHLGQPGTRTDELVGPACLMIASVCFAAAAGWVSRRVEPGGPVERAWRVMFVAAACWATGDSLAFGQVLFAGAAPPVSIADAFFLSAPVAALVGMLSFPTRVRSRRAGLLLVVDATLIGSTMIFVGGALLRRYTTADAELPLAQGVVNVTYAILDIVLGLMALFLINRTAQRERTHLALLGAGFLTYALGSVVLALDEFGRIAGTAHFCASMWVAGSAILALAALSPAAASAISMEEGERAAHPLATTILVNLPVVVTLLVAVTLASSSSSSLQHVTGLIVMVSSVARQLLMSLDNLELRHDLESLVSKRTAELIRLSRSNQLVLDAATEGIVGLDHTGKFTFLNPAAEEMIGSTSPDLIGTSAVELFATRPDGSRWTFPEHPLAESLVTGVRIVGRGGEVVARDGRAFPIEYSASPLPTEDGGGALVVTFHDVTERREVERMKDEFISVVSHELRTPMTSIRGSLGLLAGGVMGDLTPQAQGMVDIAIESSDRLTRLINDILEIERFDSGRISLDLQECSSGDLIAAAIRSVQALASDAGVLLSVPLAEGQVHADHDRVVQVLTNLIGNAVSFSPEGKEISVSARVVNGSASDPSDEGRAHVVFSVQDEGPGIPLDYQERIFNRFEQVDSSDSRRSEGTGLGLAICKSLVEAHGGRIWVVSPSEADRDPATPGSTFCFTLPMDGGSREAAPPPEGAIPSGSGAG